MCLALDPTALGDAHRLHAPGLGTRHGVIHTTDGRDLVLETPPMGETLCWTRMCSPGTLQLSVMPIAFMHLVQGSGFRVQGTGFRVQGSGFRVHASGFRAQGSGFRAQGSGFRAQGSGFRAQGSGPRVQGSGRRVQGPGFRVQGALFRVEG